MRAALIASMAALVIGGCGSGSSTSGSSADSQSETSRASNLTHVTDATFEQTVLKSDLPVLVDFWAPWCGPCKAMSPVVEEVSGEYAGRLKVVKLNVDENPKTAQAYSIEGIPSLFLFKDGKLVEQVVGAIPKATLARVLDKHL